MQRDDTVCIKHVLDAARKAVEFSKGRNRRDLDSDEKLALSLVHLLEIVGEAASGVSEDYRKEHPGVPWKNMIGLRNRLIHGYFDVNYDIVWDTVVSDLPPLITEMEKLLPP
ncbi:MAG: DUF86 domain-containing protein [Thermoplasmata archaeon]|nr:DUF86 domain-containing protein [Thermoplasmata archaeon]